MPDSLWGTPGPVPPTFLVPLSFDDEELAILSQLKLPQLLYVVLTGDMIVTRGSLSRREAGELPSR